MSSDLLQGFRAVWNWKRVNQNALDELEASLRRRLENQEDSEAQDELEQLRPCREELENFAILSLWAVFEETLNTWLAQRTQWAGASTEDDRKIREGLVRRIQHWRKNNRGQTTLFSWLFNVTAKCAHLRSLHYV